MSGKSSSDALWFEAEGEEWIDRLRSAGPVPRVRGGDLVHGQIPQDVVPGYILLRELGQGGQGVVFAALQLATRREVAIKLLREGPIATDSARRRFAREVELAASLDHSGVVHILDAGETRDGRAYIVMEFIKGFPLAKWLEEEPSMDARLLCLADICAALEHAHLRGVIHLDLKPSNVMRTEDGVVKILDFGLARSADEQDLEATVTEAMVAGTPAYMAPEQVQQPRSTWDRRTDLYAVGLLVFESLSGERPYVLTGSALQIMEGIARAQPARLSSCLAETGAVAPHLRRDLDAIVATALARDPQYRYQTAEALRQDLSAARAGQLVWARRHERGYRWRRFAIEYGPLAGIAGAIIIALLAATLFFVDLSRRERNARNDAIAAETVARERLADVRRVAHTFLHDLDPLIQYLPGASPARERIVQEGLSYLAAMRDGIGDDTELAAEISRAYTKMGQVLWDVNASHLGDPDRALLSHIAACDVLNALPPEAFDTVALAYVPNRAWLSRSVVEAGLGQQDASRASMIRARAVLERLPEELQAGSVAKLMATETTAQFAVWAFLFGDIERAVELEEEAHAAYTQLLANNPDDEKVRHDYAAGFARMGQLRVAQGDLRGGLRDYEQFREELERLSGDAASTTIYARRDLATAHEWIGRLHADLGEPELALVPLAQAIEIRTALVELDPEAGLRLELASLVNRLGEAQLAMGRLDEAEQTFGRFLAMATALQEKHPDLSRAHRLVAVAHYKRHEAALSRADAATSDSARRAALDKARAFLKSCRDVFLDMEARGLLAPADSAVPAALEEELAAIAARIGEG